MQGHGSIQQDWAILREDMNKEMEWRLLLRIFVEHLTGCGATGYWFFSTQIYRYLPQELL